MKTTAKILLFAIAWIGCGLIGSACVRARECSDLRASVANAPTLYRDASYLEHRKVSIRRTLRTWPISGPLGMFVGILISGLFYDGIEFTDACIDAIQPSEAQQ
jgi:hypothetical protein